MFTDTFTVTITTAGTRIQVSTQAGRGGRVKSIAFQPDPGNTGSYCYVGRDDVSSTTGWSLVKNRKGLLLDYGDGSEDITIFWVDSDTNGDKVQVVAVFL